MNCAHYPKSASTAFLRLLFYVSLLLLCFFTGLAPWLQVIDEGIEIGFPFHCVCVCKRIQTHARTLGSLLTQPFQQQRPSVEGQQSSCSQRFLFPLCLFYSFHQVIETRIFEANSRRLLFKYSPCQFVLSCASVSSVFFLVSETCQFEEKKKRELRLPCIEKRKDKDLKSRAYPSDPRLSIKSDWMTDSRTRSEKN